jgi:hypothetical protein
MKSKIVEIYNCEECPHYRHTEWDDNDTCFYKNIESSLYFIEEAERKIEDLRELPSWCPLDDAPKMIFSDIKIFEEDPVIQTRIMDLLREKRNKDSDNALGEGC